MAKIPTVTVQVILKFDEEVIEDACANLLVWIKERKLKSLTPAPLPLRERGEQ